MMPIRGRATELNSQNITHPPTTCDQLCRLDDFMNFYCGVQDYSTHTKIRIITSATPPFHIEWVSADWSKALGWSSEEIQGLDCKFLQGAATDLREISRFMNRLVLGGGYADTEVVNYRKDETLVRSCIRCVPLVDDCGPCNRTRVCHIGAVLEIYPLSDKDASFYQEVMTTGELGMPLDRRENSAVYEKFGDLPPPSIEEWLGLTENLALALAMRYMLRSRAAIVLLNRASGKIAHVNVGWCRLTGYSATTCEGMPLNSLFGHHTSIESLGAFQRFLEDTAAGYRSIIQVDDNQMLPLDGLPADHFSVTLPPLRIRMKPADVSLVVRTVSRFSLEKASSTELRVVMSPVLVGAAHIAVLFLGSEGFITSASSMMPSTTTL